MYLSTSQKGKFITERDNDIIKITNETSKEVKYLKISNSSETQNPVSLASVSHHTMSPANITSSGANWYEWSCIRSSYAKDWGTISLCASIAASICGLSWVTSSILSAATYIVGNNLPDIWYIQHQYDDLNNITHHKRTTYLYGYPNYTNQIGYASVEYYGGIF